METPEKNDRIPVLVLLGGACSLLLVLACLAAAVLAAAGVLLRTRHPLGAQAQMPVRHITSMNTPSTARLEDLRGWVEVQGVLGGWRPAQEGQYITAGQRVRTGELSGAALAFYDGSRASLMSDSELAIEVLDAQPQDKPRSIVLAQISGESAHKVTPNLEEGSRYLVNSPSGSGEAKGTTFHVIVTPQQAAHYSVVEGTVAVTGMDQTVLVLAGQVTTLFFDQAPLAPVASVLVEGQLMLAGETWIIADQAFVVTDNTLISGDPRPGDWVQVKGRPGPGGGNVADWIVLLRASPANHFTVVGAVEDVGEGQWKVNGQSILVSDTTTFNEAIQVGDLVRIDGWLLEDGNLQAGSIELVTPAPIMPFSFTGVVQETRTNIWVISGASILVAKDTQVDQALVKGALARVTGWIQEDGRWVAKSIAPAADGGRRFAFTGLLEQAGPWVAAGFAFEVREWTLMDENLKVGDIVRVEGSINAGGAWIASSVDRLSDDKISTLVLVGTVVSTNPWVISGIPITVSEATQVFGQVAAGALVRVQVRLLPGGAWEVRSIQALDHFAWLPGCMDILARVVSISGSQVEVLNWPSMALSDGAQVEGEITPNSLVRFRACFTGAQVIEIHYILVVQPAEVEVSLPGEDGDGGKVTVCHKPGKKGGGNTITVGEPALGAHLGHGDYIGSCR